MEVLAIFQPINLALIIAGMFLGILFGSIPGLNGTMLVALILPFSIYLRPEQGLLLMTVIYASSTYGGAATAILFNIPGSPENAVTAIDGYALRKEGKAAYALSYAIVSSSLGGVLGWIALITLAPTIAKVAYKFGPPEIFALVVFGLSTVIGISRKSVLKGALAVCCGLVLSTFGSAPSTGTPRFTFGIGPLLSGLHFIPMIIGFFALSEVLTQITKKTKKEKLERAKVKIKYPTPRDVFRHKWNILRSAAIGIFVGILPGSGSTIASFLGYNEAQRWSKSSDTFGKGNIEGVIAPETANNAAAGGALIPMLTLGIPGGAVTAVMLGVFQIHGLDPGPLLFESQPFLLKTIYAGFLVANLLILAIGIIDVKMVVNLLKIPYSILGPAIVVFSLVGSYGIRNNFVDVWTVILCGIIGFVLRRFDFPVAALVLGAVLGPIAETSFMRTMILFDYNLLGYLRRPISLVLIALIAVNIVYLINEKVKSKAR